MQRTDRPTELVNLDAEVAVLGALIIDNNVFDRLSDTLRPEHFSKAEHAKIFRSIASDLATGKRVDVFTISNATGIPATALNDIAQYVPSSANVKRHVGLLIERYKSRQLMIVSQTLNEVAHEHHRPIDERIDQVQSELGKLVDLEANDEWVTAADGLLEQSAVIDARANGETNAMPTQLIDLDNLLDGGFTPGQLVIIGARPSMGKTALAMSIGLSMARDYSVAMLSMEMPQSELNDRMTALLGNVSLSLVKRPNLGDKLDFSRVVDGIERAKSLNFVASDQGGLTINQVRSKARKVKRTYGLHVLIVDYLGLMSGLDPRMNRTYQLEEITRGLKTLAKELDIAILCLAQVNRKVEDRTESLPALSDLKDSGAIEQDADIVMFIHRPAQTNPNLGSEFDQYAKLSVAKNRNGQCGFINLHYLGEQTKFSNWSGYAPTTKAKSARAL